jgi:hypothetical protein
MRPLNQEGIYKAIPQSWIVKTFPNSLSVAISIDFGIVARFTAEGWEDWTAKEEHHVRGDYFVVGKNGKPNERTVKQLAASLGWRGSLVQVQEQSPPQTEVQVQVDAREYNGKTYHNAGWMNPGDHVPNGGEVSDADVAKLESKFGPALRDVAGSPPSPKSAAPAAAKPDDTDYGDIPF